MRKKQTRRHGFWLFMLIYGVVFLVLACIGLSIFWKYMETPVPRLPSMPIWKI